MMKKLVKKKINEEFINVCNSTLRSYIFSYGRTTKWKKAMQSITYILKQSFADVLENICS